MQDTSQENIRRVTNRSYMAVFVFDVMIGVVAYLTFLSATQGDVLNNLPNSSVLAVVARFALLDLVVLSYMVMMIPCKISLLDLLFDKNEALQEATPMQFYGLTLILNLLALGMALAVS